MPYLRTTLAGAAFLVVFVLGFGFPASGQETTSIPATVPEQTVSPTANNEKIAFSSNQDGDSEIYTVNPNGSSPTRLTNNVFADFQPVWSPDGTQIAFQAMAGHIAVMNADGSNPRILTENRGEFFNAGPTWLPDGTKIAFFSSGPPNQISDIYTMDADGSNQTNLTNSPEVHELSPDFSPDGSQMCLHRSSAGGPGTGPSAGIYVMNADASNLTRLSDELSGVECAWSPDGTKIAFTYQVDGAEEIYVMNADGTEQTNLTSNPDRDINPGWSPDGTRITFASDRDGDFEVYTMDADGSGVVQVTTNSGVDDIDPDWQLLTGAGNGNDGGGGGNGGGGNGGGGGGNNSDHRNRFHNNRFHNNRFFARGAADNQFRSERIVEERVVKETIPNNGQLANTGGIPLIGLVVIGALAIVVGVSVLRTAIRR